MRKISFHRLCVYMLALFLVFNGFDASAQKKKRFVKHPSISFGYGQAFLNNGDAGNLFSLAIDIPQDEVKFIAFEATHAQQNFEKRTLNSQGNVIGGFKSSYELSDFRVKYGYKLYQWKFLELKASPFASAFFERYATEPLTTNAYPVSGKHYGIGVGGELKCVFLAEEAVRFFVGTNYTFFRVFHAKTRVDDPTLLAKQRLTQGSDLVLFGDDSAYWLIGLNLRLW